MIPPRRSIGLNSAEASKPLLISRNRKVESTPLQRGVGCELDSWIVVADAKRRDAPVSAPQNVFESEGTNASPNTIMTRGEVLDVVYIAGSSHTPRSSAARPC